MAAITRKPNAVIDASLQTAYFFSLISPQAIEFDPLLSPSARTPSDGDIRPEYLLASAVYQKTLPRPGKGAHAVFRLLIVGHRFRR
ncbi:MAG: hypothetical protein WKF37_21805 [Bryobacteraceae bacterium]